MDLRQAQRSVGAPHVRRRLTRHVIGEQTGPEENEAVDFVCALENLDAESAYIVGESLYDDDDEVLPDVLGADLPSAHIQVLRSALEAMRFFLASKQGSNSSTAAVALALANKPPSVAWSLKTLEHFFRDCMGRMSKRERPREIASGTDDVLPLDDRAEQCSRGARITCIQSSLFHLAAVCGLLLTAPAKFLRRSAQNA